MGRIIFQIPGEPDVVLDSDYYLEMAKFFKELAVELAEDIESQDCVGGKMK